MMIDTTGAAKQQGLTPRTSEQRTRVQPLTAYQHNKDTGNEPLVCQWVTTQRSSDTVATTLTPQTLLQVPIWY